MEFSQYAREIFDYAVAVVDPRKAVAHALSLDVRSQPVYAIAIGKAAAAMAAGIDEVLGDQLTAGVISAPARFESRRWQSFVGGHPLPNEASLEAARAAFALLDQANTERAVVVFLISGGGSAMMEWPVSEEISLLDLRVANQVLVGCGASIAEMNSVRRAFSAVKGGALAERAHGAEIFTLIVSDTNRGDEASVASGPTLAAPDAPDLTDVVERYHLETVLPESIMKAIRSSKPKKISIPGSYKVLLDNWSALDAAEEKARKLGFTCITARDICEQPIQEGCDLLVTRLLEAARQSKDPLCLISGGEFSCPVRGDGRGGRNLETALRCALSLDKHRRDRHFVVLSAGTDGIDGNSPAAGAIADETTLERARKLSLDAEDFLARSDSYSFFAQLNDLIVTGPTGINVRDLRLCLTYV